MEQSAVRFDYRSQEPASRSRSSRFLPPSIPAVVFVLLAVLVPVGLQQPLLNSDGDLARHLGHGRYMLEHHSLLRQDPFSFTRPGAPFLGFEYGSQIIYALAERAGGLAAVAVLAGILIGLTYALLARFLLKRGVDPLLAYLTIAVAAALGAGHWTARPHLFSFVAVVILLGLLERTPRKAVLPLFILFVAWANLHGGFVYGLILIGLYVVGSLGELVWSHERGLWEERVRYYLRMLATAAVATIVNPHGLELHRHLFRFFSQPFLLDNTAEFASPDFHEIDGKLFLTALLLCLAVLAFSGRRPTLPRLLLLGVGTAFGLIAVRNIPLFGLTALPVLALHLDEAWRRLPDPRGIRSRFELTASRTSTLPWVLPVAVLLFGLAVTHGRLGSRHLIADRFDSSVFPVAAVAQGRREHLEGNLFSEFAWGGYLVYAWPEQKIFIDGGTDFFGEDIFRQYSKIKRLVPGWRELVRKWDISLFLLNRESSLAHELTRDSRWDLWYCDSLAVILRRARASQGSSVSAADSAERRLDGCGRVGNPL